MSAHLDGYFERHLSRTHGAYAVDPGDASLADAATSSRPAGQAVAPSH